MPPKKWYVQLLCWIIFLTYIVCVLYITLLDRTPSAGRMMLRLFWEYRELLFSGNPLYWFQQITCNILMFMPFGAFLCIKQKHITAFHAGISGLMFSVWIEAAQYITGRGLCEFDDVFHNTLGAVIGYFIAKHMFLFIQKKRSEM